MGTLIGIFTTMQLASVSRFQFSIIAHARVRLVLFSKCYFVVPPQRAPVLSPIERTNVMVWSDFCSEYEFGRLNWT